MIQLPALTLEAIFACVPAQTVDNVALLGELLGPTKAEGIVKATGFAARRVARAGTTVFDLALPAARAALADVDPASVGGVVAVSFSHADRFPALAIRLQHALGLPKDIAALDVGLACSGYPYGLFVAGQLAAAMGRKVLLVDGDVQSAHVDADDPNTLAVMSDAATATLVSAEMRNRDDCAPGEGQNDCAPGRPGACFAFMTDGSGADVLRCGADGKIRMDGFGVFRFVAGPVAAFLKDFIAASGEQPDLFAPHQANMYMVRQLAKSLGLGDRLLTSGERFANPGSCSVPLTLAAAQTPPVGRMLLAGFGAGLSAGAALVTLDASCRRGVVEL